MGEMMIDKLREDIPVVVIRPSVIESTLNEPFPGWMEGNRWVTNFFLKGKKPNLCDRTKHFFFLGTTRMMDPIVLCYGKGQLTGFLVDPNGVLDVVSDTISVCFT